MTALVFTIHPADDPLGSALATLDNEDYLEGTGYRQELNGTGSGKIIIHGDHADVDTTNFAKGNYVLVTDADLSETIGGFFLSEGDFVAVSDREAAGRILTFTGHGSLGYLGRAVWAAEPYVASGSGVYNGPRDDGMWHWFEDQYGDILKRAIDEAQDSDRPADPIPALTYSFTNTDDSNSDPWESFSDDDYTIPVGENYLQSIASWMGFGLTILMTPELELLAFQEEYGTDRSSATFTAGKVRFEAGVNIASGDVGDLVRGLSESARVSHLLVQGDSSVPADVVTVTDGGAPFDREGYLRFSGTSDAGILEDAGDEDILNRQGQTDRAILAHIPGDDEAAGLYTPGWPGGDGHYWLGDTVTLHTGTDSYDFNELDLRVAAINWVLREGGDWDIVVELGATYSSISQPSIPGTGAPSGGCSCPHPPSGSYSFGGSVVVDYLWDLFPLPDGVDDTTGTIAAGPRNSGDGSIYAASLEPAAGSEDPVELAAGTYHFRAIFRSTDVTELKGIKIIDNSEGGGTLAESGATVGGTTTEVSFDFTVDNTPAGDHDIAWLTYGPSSGHRSRVFLAEISHGTPADTFTGDTPPPASDDQVGSIGTHFHVYSLGDHKHPVQSAAVTYLTDAGGYFDGDNAEAAFQELAALATAGPTEHDEPLTDGDSNFIFASGDILVVTGVPNP